MVSRRWVIGALGAGACAAAVAGFRSARRAPDARRACPAVAGRTIRWIVPNAPGGGYDTESRMLEPHLERRLGAQIAVYNQQGAGGIVGAKTIAGARPDGSTLGIVGIPGLLLAALTGRTEAPDPVKDLSVLARVGRSWHVWAVGGRSRFRSIDEVVEAGRSRPLVFGINEAGSANFASITVTADLLGVPIHLVAGFGGTRGASLAALRGDVDLVCYDFETLRDLIEDGDLRPVLQVGAAPVSSHPAMGGVPLLGGIDGLAVRTAQTRGRDVSTAAALAGALFDVMGSGRVIVAPGGMDAGLSACLAHAIFDTLRAPEVVAAAARPIDAAPADETLALVRAAAARAHLLLPAMLAALTHMRQ